MTTPGAGGVSSPRWLLVGNSRWHWAAPADTGRSLRFWHTPPPRDDALALVAGLLGWAAVGPLPVGPLLRKSRRLTLADVPLAAAPAWLGVDRALGGWWAWRLTGGPVLVADAGTVLSFTRVGAEGDFAGGRLMAGAALQWRAMAAGTSQLPVLQPVAGMPACDGPVHGASWPVATEAAMRLGVMEGLAAAVADALREVQREDPRVQLVITGGDGPAMWEGLSRRLASGAHLLHRPALALEALAALAPVQPRPRSSRI